MLFQRIISSIIFISFLIYCIFYSRLAFLLLILAIVVLGLMEFYSLVERDNKNPFKILGILFSILLIEKAYYEEVYNFYLCSFWLLLPWLVCFGLTLIIPLFRRYARDIGGILAGIVYLGYFLSHLLLIMNFQYGNYYLLLLFSIVMMTDIAAYGIGSCFGRHKLIPSISPNKSVEGAIGGIIGAIVVSVIMGLSFKRFVSIEISLLDTLILGLLLGIFGQIGDLIESKLKRLAGVKDSGTMAYGHGGILDVFDSLIVSGLIMYCYLFFKLEV